MDDTFLAIGFVVENYETDFKRHEKNLCKLNRKLYIDTCEYDEGKDLIICIVVDNQEPYRDTHDYSNEYATVDIEYLKPKKELLGEPVLDYLNELGIDVPDELKYLMIHKT